MARSSGSPLSSVFLEFADPECEKPFRAYSGYLQDLAGLIAAEHGFRTHAGQRRHRCSGSASRRGADQSPTAQRTRVLGRGTGAAPSVVKPAAHPA